MTTLMQDAARENRAMSFRVKAVGRELTRYGLVLAVGWIGLMKFTTHEAEGIRPFVANSPLMSWGYPIKAPYATSTTQRAPVSLGFAFQLRTFLERQ